MLNGMWWSLLACAALGAPIPFALPPGEDAGAWAEPLALADLAPGAPPTGPRVAVEVAGERWRLVVRDTAGALHVVEVAAPRSRAEREAAAHLAASLARPVPLLSLPLPAPTVPPPPMAAPPPERPVASPIAPPAEVATVGGPEAAAPAAPTGSVVEAPAAVAAAPPVATPATPASEPARVVEAPPPVDPWAAEGWARLGGGLAWRDQGGAVSGTALAGVGAGPVRVGLGGAASGPHRVVGTDLVWSSWDGLAGAWFALPEGPSLGVLGGISRRRYGDLTVARSLAGAELGWRARLAPAVDLYPVLRVDLDPGVGGLRRTTVTVDGQPALELAPLALKLELGVSAHGGAR